MQMLSPFLDFDLDLCYNGNNAQRAWIALIFGK